MATIQNERDKLLQAAPVRFVLPPIPPSRIPGLPGAFTDISNLQDDVEDLEDAVGHLMNTSSSFAIRASALTFIGSSGTTSPASITLTAVRGSGLAGGTVAWSVFAGIATISPVSGDTCNVTGSSVVGASVTVRAQLTIDGQIHDAYVTLARLGSVASQDVIDLTSQVTGQLANSNVSGLGALALLNTININSQTTGSLNALNRVTNLGDLAFANAIAANQIGAGQLAAGVIYAGEINAEQITSGTLTGRTIQTNVPNPNAYVGILASTNEIIVRKSTVDIFKVGGSVSRNAEAHARSAVVHGLAGESSASGYCGVFGYATGGADGMYCVATGSGNGASAAATSGSNFLGHGIIGHRAGYDFYATGQGVNYGPFTGAHDAIIRNDVTGYELGDIMIDVRLVATRGISDTLFEVAPSSEANQKGAVGVCARIIGPLHEYEPKAFIAEHFYQPDTISGSGEEILGEPMTLMCGAYYDSCDDYTYIAVNSLGEGQINVCGQNGNLEAGDLIVCSDTPGKGMRQMLDGQPDDIVRAHTVARVRADVVFDEPGEVKLVPCIYLCG